MNLTKKKRTTLYVILMACFLTCLFGFVSRLKADEPKEKIDLSSYNYKQVILNQDQGLGSPEVKCVMQSKSGFIWVGTDGGLYRYNGNDFKLFKLWDTEKDDVYSINSLFQDSTGRLWVATSNYGLFYIKGNHVVHFTSDYNHGVKSINSVAESQDGNIYVGTIYGLYQVSEDGKNLNRIESLAGKNIKGLASLKDKVWGISGSNGLFTIDKNNTIVDNPADSMKKYDFTAVTSDDNYLYLGTSGKTMIRLTSFYDAKEYTGSHEGINNLYRYQDKVFLCSDDGIEYFSTGNFYPIQDTSINTYISSMTIDNEGNIWIGSSRMGLLLMTRSKFGDYNKTSGVSFGVTNSILESDGQKYIGTDNGLVIMNTRNEQVKSDITDYLKGVSIRSIKKDSAGNLWFAAYRRYGVIVLKTDGEIVNLNANESSKILTSLVNTTYELSDGRIAIATEEGITILNSDFSLNQNITYDSGLQYSNILSLCEGKKGELVAGSNGGGIYVITEDSIKNYSDTDGLTSNVVSALTRGSDGIWIGTDNGVSYYDETVRSISNIDFSNNIYDILYDADKMYILGSKGLLITNESNLLEADKQVERYYSSGDGLAKTLTISGKSCLDQYGRLYISCNEGIATFDTKNIYLNKVAPKLTVSAVDVDDKRYNYDQLGGELKVPADTHRITISFSVLSFVNRENIKVKYMLKGFDANEQTLGGNDNLQAVYTNLDGGTYTFTVTAENGDGVKTESEISLKIVKGQKIYEKTYVRLIFGILTLALMTGLVFLVIILKKNVQGKNREFEKLVREHEDEVKNNNAKIDYLANMSNEIKTPVNAIISSASNLMKDDISAGQHKELMSIVDTANNVLNRVDETIKLARLEAGTEEVLEEPYSITTLVCDLSDRMLKLIEGRPVKFLVDIGKNIPDIHIGDFEKIKEILNIILNNASDYTDEGSITLSVDCYELGKNSKEENLIFSVADTGSGISKEELPNIFRFSGNEDSKGSSTRGINLTIARKLTEIMNGEIEAESTFGSGSIFTLTLRQSKPQNNVHPIAANENAAERVSKEEAERMWAPQVSALLVDDDELSLNVSLENFNKMEIRCDTAKSGVGAIDMMMNKEYDIVFMDVNMPVMNGLDTLKEIRELPDVDSEDIPFVAMTEDPLAKGKGDLIKDGFKDVIVKPFDIATFASMLKKLVPSEKIRTKTNDYMQYITESRYSKGLNELSDVCDVAETLEKIGGNIEVYNRILVTYYNQNIEFADNLKELFNTDYRQLRNKVHLIRTSSQNIGAYETFEIAMRIDNAINIGNRTYARDNLDALIESLDKVLAYIQSYIQFLKDTADQANEMDGMEDSRNDEALNLNPLPDEDAGSDVEEDSLSPKVISMQKLTDMKTALIDEELEEVVRIFNDICEDEYVEDDMEFLSALREQIDNMDKKKILDLIMTYMDLKSV